MKVLELFAGERCIGKAFEKKGHEVYSIDWDKVHPDIDWYTDISKVTAQDILERFGQPDVVWESPDCTSYSLAAISHHRRKINGALVPITEYAKFCDELNVHCNELIAELNPKLWFRENPRGAMRKMPFVAGQPRYTVTYCLGPDTKVVTDQGEYPISSLVDQTVKLLTKDGAWVDAPIRYYGDQEVMKITLTRHSVVKHIYATSNHRWYTKYGKILETNALKAGMFIEGGVLCRQKCNIINDWVARGFTYGDGWILKNYPTKKAFAMFCGEKAEMLKYFDGCCGKVFYDTHNGKKIPKVYGMPREWKIEMPSTKCSNDEIYSWLAGYLAADGTVGVHNGQVTLSSAKKEDLLYIRVLCRKIGIGTYDVTEYRRRGLGKNDTPIYTLTFMKSDIDSMFLLRNVHRENFNSHARCKHQARRWRVVAVEATGCVEPVYCADVQEFHNFIIEGDIVTHNCQYGDTRQKPTDIWTNHPDPKFLPPCKPGSPCHEAAPRGSRTGTQGRDGHVKRSLIPDKLCDHIVRICEEYMQSLEKKDERL